MPEMDWQDVFGEFLDLLDDESLSVFGPANDIAVFVVLNGGTVTSRIS